MQKTVLIVGASSGIGQETARLFLKDGSAVYNLSRKRCDLAGVRNIPCDLAKPQEMSAALSLLENLPTLDIMVYSAGFSMASPLEYAEETDYRYLFEVNFFGFLALTKAMLPKLKKSGGSICAVSSVGGVIPIAYDAFYSASKGALNLLIAALRLELAPQGVKVIAVLPGGTATRFTFKRKVYPLKNMGEYANEMQQAVESLQEIEQHGMRASAVAKTIYRRCTKPCLSHLYAAGLSNKCALLLQKLLPQSILYLLTRIIYF